MSRLLRSRPEKPLFFALTGTLCLLLSACSHIPYSITFNDNVVYVPGGKASMGPLKDSALQGCLNQALAADTTLTAATITLLACPSAGVESLEGIAALESLEQLELSDNRITNLSPLSSVKKLRVLSIRNNDVGNVGILDNLPILRFVALQGNNSVPCHQLDALQKRLGNTLGRPLECH